MQKQTRNEKLFFLPPKPGFVSESQVKVGAVVCLCFHLRKKWEVQPPPLSKALIVTTNINLFFWDIQIFALVF
jgi:hypothetical protein